MPGAADCMARILPPIVKRKPIFRPRIINQEGMKRDIIVVGASAGGIMVLRQLFSELPDDMAAVMAVVLHRGATPGQLVSVLSTRSKWPVMEPENGTLLKPRTVFLAPADHHLCFDNGKFSVDRGPKEHGTRPAVDPLFRSAALHYRDRVVALILTGCGDDGVAGLISINAHRGICLAQNPEESYMPSMPQNAIRYDDVDQVLSVSDMVPVLRSLANGQKVRPAA